MAAVQPGFLDKIPLAISQNILASYLQPEDVASLMKTNKKAHQIFGDKRIWKALAMHLHIRHPFPGPLAPDYRCWRKDVIDLYDNTNQFAVSCLDHNHNSPSRLIPDDLDVFIQHTHIKNHLECLDPIPLRNYCGRVIDRALEREQPGAIKILVTSGGRIAEMTQRLGIRNLIDDTERGQDRHVENLLTGGILINGKNADGHTALMRATYYSRNEMIQILIAHGANANEKDIDGRNALFWASQRWGAVEHELNLMPLIENGANVNERDNRGHTPIMHAVVRQRNDILETLLVNGADANLSDNSGLTPLLMAHRSPREDPTQIQLLLNHGAINPYLVKRGRKDSDFKERPNKRKK